MEKEKEKEKRKKRKRKIGVGWKRVQMAFSKQVESKLTRVWEVFLEEYSSFCRVH